MPVPRRALLASAVGLSLLLGACGTTDTTAEDGPAGASAVAPQTSAGCEAGTAPAATGPVSLTDSWGRSVRLDEPADRVAVLEWQQLEDVLTLCLTPVAVSDPEGYGTWNTAVPLPDGVTDVGTRGEPNLDALVGTDPDLVVVEAYSPDDEIIGRLEKYGIPVLATKGADAADPVQNMLDTFTLIAEATGRQERAETVVADFREHLEEATAEVESAKPQTTDFVYFDGYLNGGTVALRPFGQGSLVGELGEALGLRNAWTGPVDAAYGLGTTDIEGMTAVGDAAFFHTGTVDPAGDVMAALGTNAVWAALPAVREDRVTAFPTGVWTFGGPKSAERIVDAYVDALTS